MSAPRTRSRLTSPGAAVVCSLVPWAAFLLAVTKTHSSFHKPVSLLELLGEPVTLGFVALPSLLALAAARTRLTRLVVLMVMTGVAAWAGVSIVTTDDAQAGLAVLWVPFVALPLATVAWVGHNVAAHWHVRA
jgi:hypothetical protein